MQPHGAGQLESRRAGHGLDLARGVLAPLAAKLRAPVRRLGAGGTILRQRGAEIVEAIDIIAQEPQQLFRLVQRRFALKDLGGCEIVAAIDRADATELIARGLKRIIPDDIALSAGVSDIGGIIVLEMDKVSFSFSEISKLVETNDAQITQLNTYTDTYSGNFYITLRINKLEISDIVATFQRYEYQVKYYFGEELYENELRNNYDHLMNYLNI